MAVAFHANPDILIIDESLAAGDAAFRAKCVQRLDEISRSGISLLVVSHSLSRVGELCDRCILMRGGKVAVDGRAEDVIAQYIEVDLGGKAPKSAAKVA